MGSTWSKLRISRRSVVLSLVQFMSAQKGVVMIAGITKRINNDFESLTRII